MKGADRLQTVLIASRRCPEPVAEIRFTLDFFRCVVDLEISLRIALLKIRDKSNQITVREN